LPTLAQASCQQRKRSQFDLFLTFKMSLPFQRERVWPFASAEERKPHEDFGLSAEPEKDQMIPE
jgi:hypothetical protein